MLWDPFTSRVGIAGSARRRVFERLRDQAPPGARCAFSGQRRQRPREIDPASFVASARLRYEPVIGGDPVDVQASTSGAYAEDPLARCVDFDDNAWAMGEGLGRLGHG
jgi:hypothetical protein